MDSQTPTTDISNISKDSVAPKKRYIKKPKEEIAKEIIAEPVEVIAKENIAESVKPKRGQSEKTKLALAEGRKKLAELNFQKRVEREQFINEQVNKKANRIAEQKLKLLNELNLDDDDDDESILADVKPKATKAVKPVKAVAQPKAVKPKKSPKVVYISEDEEEEEEQEIIYKTKPKSNNREAKPVKQQPQAQQPQTVNKPLYPSIIFY